MKIMIGLDDSPHSEAALEYVRTMSWPAGTRVIVASAMRPAVLVYSEVYVPAVPPEGLLEDQRRTHQELVSRGEQKLQGVGLKTEARVLNGDPRDALIEAIRAEKVDLLVVGSHGRTGLAKLLMGSVASHVVAHAPCSVLVVKLRGPA